METNIETIKNRISKEQFDSYEDTRLSGCYNMFSRQARDETGLSKDDYIFVMKHYNTLVKLYTKHTL